MTGDITMQKKQNKNISLKNVQVQDGFWKPMQDLIIETVIPYQEKILNDEIPGVEKSHALANFRIAAGMEKGEFYGMVFQDSDVAKWLEAVAYSLVVHPDAELEKRADEVIETIEKAQQEDGYLNTYFTIKEPEHRWQNLQECHELYCAGHMMEAAVAYYDATGKDKLLKVMERMADHIDRRFGPDKITGIPGHQEVEIGLMRLYHTTGEERYCNLAEYFINERGKKQTSFTRNPRNAAGHILELIRRIPCITRALRRYMTRKKQWDTVCGRYICILQWPILQAQPETSAYIRHVLICGRT